jgi:hypothetical protein
VEVGLPCRKASLVLYLIGCFVGGGKIAKNNLW